MRSPGSWPRHAAALTVLLGIAISLIVNWISDSWTNPVAWALGLLFTALAAALAYWGPPTLHTPQLDASDLASEAAFTDSPKVWYLRRIDPEWIAEQVRDLLTHPALVDPKRANRALAKSESAMRIWRDIIAIRNEQYRRELNSDDFDVRVNAVPPVQQCIKDLLQPVFEVLPTRDEALRVMRSLPRGAVADAIEAEYNKKAVIDDQWAWAYLRLLRDLGENQRVLRILESRLEDPSITFPERENTIAFGEEVLGRDSFQEWRSRFYDEEE